MEFSFEFHGGWLFSLFGKFGCWWCGQIKKKSDGVYWRSTGWHCRDCHYHLVFNMDKIERLGVHYDIVESAYEASDEEMEAWEDGDEDE